MRFAWYTGTPLDRKLRSFRKYIISTGRSYNTGKLYVSNMACKLKSNSLTIQPNWKYEARAALNLWKEFEATYVDKPPKRELKTQVSLEEYRAYVDTLLPDKVAEAYARFFEYWMHGCPDGDLTVTREWVRKISLPSYRKVAPGFWDALLDLDPDVVNPWEWSYGEEIAKIILDLDRIDMGSWRSQITWHHLVKVLGDRKYQWKCLTRTRKPFPWGITDLQRERWQWTAKPLSLRDPLFPEFPGSDVGINAHRWERLVIQANWKLGRYHVINSAEEDEDNE